MIGRTYPCCGKVSITLTSIRESHLDIYNARPVPDPSQQEHHERLILRPIVQSAHACTHLSSRSNVPSDICHMQTCGMSHTREKPCNMPPVLPDTEG